MRRLVRLDRPPGEPCYVDPAMVAAIGTDEDGDTTLWFAGGGRLWPAGTVAEVAARLGLELDEGGGGSADPGLATSPPVLRPHSRWRNAAGSVATVAFVHEYGSAGRDRVHYTTIDDAGRASQAYLPANRFRELYPEAVEAGGGGAR